MSETYPNAGPTADLGRYRTGETPIVGDVVEAHGEGHMRFESCPEMNGRQMRVRELQPSINCIFVDGLWQGPFNAARFDLISRAVVPLADSPDAGKMVEPETGYRCQKCKDTGVFTHSFQPGIARELMCDECRDVKPLTLATAPEPTLLEAAERYVALDSIENFRALKAAVERAKGGG